MPFFGSIVSCISFCFRFFLSLLPFGIRFTFSNALAHVRTTAHTIAHDVDQFKENETFRREEETQIEKLAKDLC